MKIPGFLIGGAVPKEKVGDVLEQLYLAGATRLDIRPIFPEEKKKQINGTHHALPHIKVNLYDVIAEIIGDQVMDRRVLWKTMIERGIKQASARQAIDKMTKAGGLVKQGRSGDVSL